MSQYPVPPSFDGQYNYAPPWPVHLPHDSSDPNRSGANFFAMNNAPIDFANFAGLPFGSVQLPGLEMAPNPTLMPYQPQQFAYDQTLMPFYGAFNGPFDGPNEPLHSTQEETAATPSKPSKPSKKKRKSLPIRRPSKSLKHPLPSYLYDTDREEGEVSDNSGHDLSRHRSRRTMHTGKITAAGPEAPLSRSQSALGIDTSLSRSQTPLRSNGANASMPANNSPPYNPPVTIGTTETSQVKPKKVDASLVGNGNSKQSSHSQPTGKSPAQIRVMAQGALLSLAPHNIRFSELVKEDIDPTVLKQLYDDIGIKVTSAVPKLDVANVKTTKPIIDKLDSSATAQEKLPLASSASVSNVETKDLPISASAKPLERKDVIARMLAEKAKKKATNVIADSALDATTLRNDSTSASSIEKTTEVPKTQLPTQTKEKNKALSELAKQRIEQLKKMGLRRQQSNPESTNVPSAPVSSISNTPIVKPETTIPLHHPLPERPPVAPSSPKPSTPQPLELSLSSEPRDMSSPSIVENRSMGASTPFKNSLGKRPRASDFDEPIPEIKKHSMNERLVIDISEDESFDEEDIEMSEASDPAMNTQPLKSGDNTPRVTISRNASSASGTSQSRASELESLRQKNLEIQAMRRRIAELEEKNAKKTKATPPLATVVGNGSPSPATINIETDENKSQLISDKAQPLAARSEKPDPQRLQRSPSVQSLASMDNSDLDRIRQKLLRKRVIESGLPNLDAELMKFEAKLAEYKREEERLLSEIARSREERKRLGEELESLGMETEGLTLEELRAAKEDIERGTAVEVGPDPQEIIPPESMPSSGALKAATGAVNTTQVPQIPSLQSDYPIPERTLSERQEVSDVADIEDSGLESSGSSMDESTSSSASSSIDQDLESEPEQEAVVAPLEPRIPVATEEVPARGVSPVEAPQPATFIPTNVTSTEAPTMNTDPAMDVDPAVDATSAADGLNGFRESSVLSDNYEPPEPEDSDEAYSPKLSPKDIEEPEIEPAPQLMVSNDADMTLTRKPQDFVVIASKGDALDNTLLGGDTVSKFSPYQSPLKYFKAYRYHPNYLENVKDGYRSLTYSHQINSQQPFCPYEAAGGVCNDATCDFQHWRDVVMPDDKILVDMGNQREGKTTEEREAYIEGLKDLINNMQRDQVNDFPTVAGEIAAYRRRFLSDPSRILPL